MFFRSSVRPRGPPNCASVALAMSSTRPALAASTRVHRFLRILLTSIRKWCRNTKKWPYCLELPFTTECTQPKHQDFPGGLCDLVVDVETATLRGSRQYFTRVNAHARNRSV